MIYYDYQKHWIIWISFFIAFLLQIMPCPNIILIFKPNLVFLILFYWILVLPYRVNIGTGFLIGSIIDLINGYTLGIHALAMSIFSYILALKFQLLRSLTLYQQVLIVIFFSLFIDIIVFLLEFLIITTPFHPEIFWKSIINGIFWPWLFSLVNRIHQHYFIY